MPFKIQQVIYNKEAYSDSLTIATLATVKINAGNESEIVKSTFEMSTLCEEMVDILTYFFIF